MAKTAGLSQASPKMLEFSPFPKEFPQAALLYRQAMGFYRVFKNTFGHGYQIVLEKYHIPIDDISPCIVNFHFAVELILKSLIALRGKYDYDHKIAAHLKKATEYHPKLFKILNNSEYMLLLEELGENFHKIRYSEGTLCLRHNNKEGWEHKKPLEELSESFHDILNILFRAFEEATKQS